MSIGVLVYIFAWNIKPIDFHYFEKRSDICLSYYWNYEIINGKGQIVGCAVSEEAARGLYGK